MGVVYDPPPGAGDLSALNTPSTITPALPWPPRIVPAHSWYSAYRMSVLFAVP